MLSSRQVNSSLWRLGLLWNQAILFHKGIQIHEKLYSLGTRNPSILVIMDDNCMTHTHTVHASINDQCWSIPINDGSNFWHWSKMYLATLIIIDRHWCQCQKFDPSLIGIYRHWSLIQHVLCFRGICIPFWNKGMKILPGFIGDPILRNLLVLEQLLSILNSKTRLAWIGWLIWWTKPHAHAELLKCE